MIYLFIYLGEGITFGAVSKTMFHDTTSDLKGKYNLFKLVMKYNVPKI